MAKNYYVRKQKGGGLVAVQLTASTLAKLRAAGRKGASKICMKPIPGGKRVKGGRKVFNRFVSKVAGRCPKGAKPVR